MTRDDIIAAARAGWSDGNATAPFPEKLIRMCMDAAVRAEREACCRIVTGLCISDNNAAEINRVIRARGEK